MEFSIIAGLVAAIAGIGALIIPLIKVLTAFAHKASKVQITISSDGQELKTISIESEHLTEKQLQEIVNFLKEAEDEKKTISKEK